MVFIAALLNFAVQEMNYNCDFVEEKLYNSLKAAVAIAVVVLSSPAL